MNPGTRITAVAEFMCGDKAIDIGCDHGYLAAHLLLSGKCKTAVCSDIGKMPLEKSRETALKYGTYESTLFFVSDGFDSIPEDLDFDTAFICGMGGLLIADIIRRGRDRAKRFVCQPMSHPEGLRKWLVANGFIITDERFATENGKPYVIIVVEKTEKAGKPYSYPDTYLGIFRPSTKDFAEFTKKTLLMAEKRFTGTGNRDDADLIAECKEILNSAP